MKKRPWSDNWRYETNTDNLGETECVAGSIRDEENYYLFRVWSDTPNSDANAKLASKAPEMAELLIRLINWPKTEDDYADLVHDAKEVLKECGYEG